MPQKAITAAEGARIAHVRPEVIPPGIAARLAELAAENAALRGELAGHARQLGNLFSIPLASGRKS
jgi:hypothetical protein